MGEKTLGQLAFEAYNESKGGVTCDGKPIPPWSDVGDAVRSGWEVAALAVALELQRAKEATAVETPMTLDVSVTFVTNTCVGDGFRAIAHGPADLRSSTEHYERDRGMLAATPGDALRELAEFVDRDVAELGWRASALFNQRAPVVDEAE